MQTSRSIAGPCLALLAAALLSACAGMASWEAEQADNEPEQQVWNPPKTVREPEPLPQRAYGPGEYMVRQGDTLYSIAFRNQLDYRDIARWNNIGADYRIYSGQVLRLSPTSPMAPRSGQITAQSVDLNEIEAQPRAISTTPTPVRMGEPVPVPAPVPVPVPVPVSPPASGVAMASPAVPDSSTAGVPIPGKVTPSWPSAGVVAAPPSIPEGSAGVSGWRWPVAGTVVRGYNLDSGSRGLDFGGDVGQPVVAAAAGKVVYSGSALKGYGELVIIKHDDLRLSAYGYNRRRLVNEGDSVAAGQQIAELGMGPENKPMLHFEIRERGKPVNPVPYLAARPSGG